MPSPGKRTTSYEGFGASIAPTLARARLRGVADAEDERATELGHEVAGVGERRQVVLPVEQVVDADGVAEPEALDARLVPAPLVRALIATWLKTIGLSLSALDRLSPARRDEVSREMFTLLQRSPDSRSAARMEELVAEIVPGATVSFASDASPDRRNYRVNCDKIRRVLPSYQPQWTVRRGVEELYAAYRDAAITAEQFFGPSWMRVLHLKQLMAAGRVDGETEAEGVTSGLMVDLEVVVRASEGWRVSQAWLSSRSRSGGSSAWPPGLAWVGSVAEVFARAMLRALQGPRAHPSRAMSRELEP